MFSVRLICNKKIVLIAFIEVENAVLEGVFRACDPRITMRGWEDKYGRIQRARRPAFPFALLLGKAKQKRVNWARGEFLQCWGC